MEGVDQFRELRVLRRFQRVGGVGACGREPANRHVAPFVVLAVFGGDLLHGLELDAVYAELAQIAVRRFQPFCKPRKRQPFVGGNIRLCPREDVAHMDFENRQVVPTGRLEPAARARYGIVILDYPGARGLFKGVCVWVNYRRADVEGCARQGVVAVDMPDVSAPLEVFRRARRPDRPVGSRSLQEQAVVLSRPPMPDVRGARARREYRKLCAASLPPRSERLVRTGGAQKLRRLYAHVDFHLGDFHPYFAPRIARAGEF